MDLNSSGGTMGAVTRPSAKTKTTRKTKPQITLPNTRGCCQPRKADSRNPYTTPVKPMVTVAAPSQSTRLAIELRDSGTCQTEMAITTTASGRLMKKTQCHDTCSISHPPRTGPRAVVIAVNPDQVPIACPRDCSSKDALMIARLPGTRNAAATPCTQRQATKLAMLDEKPQPAEAMANTPTPTRNIARLPKESPSAPPTRIRAERNKPYDSTTH